MNDYNNMLGNHIYANDNFFIGETVKGSVGHYWLNDGDLLYSKEVNNLLSSALYDPVSEIDMVGDECGALIPNCGEFKIWVN